MLVLAACILGCFGGMPGDLFSGKGISARAAVKDVQVTNGNTTEITVSPGDTGYIRPVMETPGTPNTPDTPNTPVTPGTPDASVTPGVPGGMPTAAGSMDITAAAKACGYSYVASASSYEELGAVLKEVKTQKKPCMIEVKCMLGAREDLGRPTTSALENKREFMEYLAGLA